MTTAQDFDRLSAYLDNQLSPAEKAGLEARLEHEPELKAALDDLRRAVRALRCGKASMNRRRDGANVSAVERNFAFAAQESGRA